MNPHRTVGIVLALALAMGVAACDDSSGPGEPGTMPELPPLASLQADFAFWDQGGPGAEIAAPPSGKLGSAPVRTSRRRPSPWVSPRPRPSW